MGLYAWIAALVCIAGTVVNVWRCNACFAFWFVGEVMWAAFDWRTGLHSRLVLDLLGISLAVLGAYRNGITGRSGKSRIGSGA